jgi:hypothetical protein
MYIIFIAFILGFIFLTYNIISGFIFNLLDNYKDNYRAGLVWFSGLVIFNVMLVAFIQFSHYYIKTHKNMGTFGLQGYKGLKGSQGDNVEACNKGS